MNPKKLAEHNGAQFGFAQNGDFGVKLVHVTPPVRMLHHGMFAEAKWKPAEMPLRYDSAPTLVNNFGVSDVPSLLTMISDVRRESPVAQFSSKFRSRRRPLPNQVGREVLEVYARFRRENVAISEEYVDALPYPPPLIDHDRETTYRKLLENGIGHSGFDNLKSELKSLS